MSYQFEDESALEELLNQQLDRRRQQQQTSKTGGRPGTSTGGGGGGGSSKQTSSSLLRPSTASSATQRQTTRFEETTRDEPSSLGAPKSKLSQWLEGGSSGGGTKEGASNRVVMDQQPRSNDNPSSLYPLSETSQTQLDRREMKKTGRDSISNYAQRQPDINNNNNNINSDDDGELNSLLAPDRLQEMSKQRLIQLILEQIVPKLSNLSQMASKQSALELERLAGELQAERNRAQVIELRHEEQLKLEQQKSAQLSGQLELRLEASERELAKVMSAQREHLEQLDGQYGKSLKTLSENYEQRVREEKLRFEEILKARDEMHRLEMESKLNVSCNLTKLDTIQGEWRSTLANTIELLEGHFKLVESALDKQTLQVRGTNAELANKSKQLCDQYDKFEHCNQQLASVAQQASELLPQIVESQHENELLRAKTNHLLESLDRRLELLAGQEKALESKREELEAAERKSNEERNRLALDSSRIQIKEERLDELLKVNGECKLKLTSERAALHEQQAQAQIKRVTLDERAADLKEQNYTLHLLRKRLTYQREELIKAQVQYVEEKKLLKSEKSQVAVESKRLVALRTRVQHELDQLGRLQRSLVCSLCMGRLFSAGGKYEQQCKPLQVMMTTAADSNNNNNQDKTLYSEYGDYGDDNDHSKLLGALSGRQKQEQEPEVRQQQVDKSAVTVAKNDVFRQKTMPNNDRAGAGHDDDDDGNDLDLELRQTELESSQLAAENKYIEQLLRS